jgi:hypothetical protein
MEGGWWKLVVRKMERTKNRRGMSIIVVYSEVMFSAPGYEDGRVGGCLLQKITSDMLS